MDEPGDVRSLHAGADQRLRSTLSASFKSNKFVREEKRATLHWVSVYRSVTDEVMPLVVWAVR